MLKKQLSRICEIFLISGRRYVTARHAQRAVLLTYYTLFSIVPLAALLFGIAKGFSLEKNLQEIIENRAVSHRELLQYISEFAERTLAEASGGVVAGIGVMRIFEIFNSIFIATPFKCYVCGCVQNLRADFCPRTISYSHAYF